MASWKETVKRTQLTEGNPGLMTFFSVDKEEDLSLSERSGNDSDSDESSTSAEESCPSEKEETPPKVTRPSKKRPAGKPVSSMDRILTNSNSENFRPNDEETPRSKRRCDNRSAYKKTLSMERMMQAMISNQEQLIAANKALEKQVKDLNEVVASYKVAEKSKKVTEKINVPNVIKGLVRDGHKEAVAAGKSVWMVEQGKSIHSPENVETSTFVRSYVTGIAIDVDRNVLNEAMKNYFRSKKQDASRRKEHHREKMRKYERKNQKKKTRLRALAEKTWPVEKKAKAKASLIIDFMSSEDEDEEDANNRIVRPLSWESAKMKALKEALDVKWKKMQSRTSKRQTLNRVVGDVSDRPRPAKIREEHAWAVATYN